MSGMEPMMLAAVASAAASGVQGVGQFAVSRGQAAALDRQGMRERQLGERESRRRDREGREAVATATTRAAASGFTVEGSALDVIGDMAQQADANARAARYEGELRALRYRNEAKAARAQGTISLLTSAVQATSSLAGAGAFGGEGAAASATKKTALTG